MLHPGFIIIAVLFRFLAGWSYARATWRGAIRPNPVTWLFWGIAPLVAFLAQLRGSMQPTAWVTLALSVGPLAIFVIALVKHRQWKIGRFDIWCGACALLGIVLWQTTNQPLLALIFGILADILGGIPTVRKAYLVPHTERARPYLLTMISMVITLLTIHDWRFITYAFPVYIFLINLVIFVLVASRIGVRQSLSPPAEA